MFATVVVMDTTGIKDTHTASLYELAFTVTHSVSVISLVGTRHV